MNEHYCVDLSRFELAIVLDAVNDSTDSPQVRYDHCASKLLQRIGDYADHFPGGYDGLKEMCLANRLEGMFDSIESPVFLGCDFPEDEFECMLQSVRGYLREESKLGRVECDLLSKLLLAERLAPYLIYSLVRPFVNSN